MSSPCYVYDLTIKAEAQSRDEVREWLQQLAKKWVFQLEKGTESGYLHYQCRISLFKKQRLGDVIKLCRNLGIEGFHLSLTANPAAADMSKGEAFYCMKADTREDGPWTDKTAPPVYIPRQYRNIPDLFPWQKVVKDSADDFNARSINYVYDPDGNNGKSTIAALMDLEGKCLDLPPVNDADRLVATVCDILMAKRLTDPKVMFIDMPRSMDKKHLRGVYTAIEQIKKGKVYDLRYSYKEWWFDAPQIWVFSNVPPYLNAMSRDRWRLWTINGAKELINWHSLIPVPIVPEG